MRSPFGDQAASTTSITREPPRTVSRLPKTADGRGVAWHLCRGRMSELWEPDQEITGRGANETTAGEGILCQLLHMTTIRVHALDRRVSGKTQGHAGHPGEQ